MGEARAGAARSSVAEVAPLEAAARGISARPGMRGSLTVTKEAEKELLGGLQCVICFFFIFHVGTTLLFTYHKRIHPFGWITWLDYFRATVDALTKRS